MANPPIEPRHLAQNLVGRDPVEMAGHALIFGFHLHVHTLNGVVQPQGGYQRGDPHIWYVDVVDGRIVGVNIDPFRLGTYDVKKPMVPPQQPANKKA